MMRARGDREFAGKPVRRKVPAEHQHEILTKFHDDSPKSVIEEERYATGGQLESTNRR